MRIVVDRRPGPLSQVERPARAGDRHGPHGAVWYPAGIPTSLVATPLADAVEGGRLEIVPGLHRLRTPMTSKALPWIMPYAFEGPEGVSLFDSGYGTPEATEWLTQQLHGIGYQPSDIRRLAGVVVDGSVGNARLHHRMRALQLGHATRGRG